MQFQVPQFIEVEDKIVGPLTFKQAIYVVGAVGVSYVLWQVLPTYIAPLPIVLIVGLGFALAFYKYNERPFILAMESAFYFLISRKLYLWDTERKKKDPVQKKKAEATNTAVQIPKLADSRLHELAWSLDINERIDRQQAREREGLTPAVPQQNAQSDLGIRTAQDARV